MLALFSMKMIEAAASQIDWSLDFSPLRKNPDFLPVLGVKDGENIKALTGFEKKSETKKLNVVILNDPSESLDIGRYMDSLWPHETLLPLESLRYNRVLGRAIYSDFLLTWPMDFQNYLDEKQVGLKNLRPLENLKEWQKEIVEVILRLEPSSSQVREILDLMCDLKFMGLSWNEVSSFSSETSKWMLNLRKLRTPMASSRDDAAAKAVRDLPWPRGTMAKWERHGDQSSLVFQARVTNLKEWQRLKDNLVQINIGESLWN